MNIRQESMLEYKTIYNLIKEAFETAEHADGNEQDLVTALRNGHSYIPQLSLVAEINGELVGHIMFTEAKVGSETVLVLAPLSIKPQYQGQGIGSALIKEGHKIAKDLGYQYSMVLGSTLYYQRFGYIPAEALGVKVPHGIPAENFMGIKLIEKAKPISGKLTYAAEFEM